MNKKKKWIINTIQKVDTHLITNIPRGFQTNTDAWGRVIFKICVSPNYWMSKSELFNKRTRG